MLRYNGSLVSGSDDILISQIDIDYRKGRIVIQAGTRMAKAIRVINGVAFEQSAVKMANTKSSARKLAVSRLRDAIGFFTKEIDSDPTDLEYISYGCLWPEKLPDGVREEIGDWKWDHPRERAWSRRGDYIYVEIRGMVVAFHYSYDLDRYVHIFDQCDFIEHLPDILIVSWACFNDLEKAAIRLLAQKGLLES